MRLLMVPQMALEDVVDNGHDYTKIPEASKSSRFDCLREDYEHRAMSGDGSRLRRSLRGLRDNLGFSRGEIVRIVAEAIPHVRGEDEAEWLLEEMEFEVER